MLRLWFFVFWQGPLSESHMFSPVWAPLFDEVSGTNLSVKSALNLDSSALRTFFADRDDRSFPLTISVNNNNNIDARCMGNKM